MPNIELKGFKKLRGLDALIQQAQSTEDTKIKFSYAAIDTLSPGRFQPRSEFDETSLKALATSIQAQGIISPLIVRPLPRGNYEIIAGERRWRAAKIAGLKEVPVIVREVGDDTALAFALIENIQRENLNVLEEAQALHQLQHDFGFTHNEIATRVGRSRATVTNMLRLLALDESVKDLLKSTKIEMGHARALLTLTREDQLYVAQEIVNKNLSVREAERLARNSKNQQEEKQTIDPDLQELLTQYTHQLSDRLSMRVNIKLNRHNKGKLLIELNSMDDLSWLVKHLRVD